MSLKGIVVYGLHMGLYNLSLGVGDCLHGHSPLLLGRPILGCLILINLVIVRPAQVVLSMTLLSSLLRCQEYEGKQSYRCESVQVVHYAKDASISSKFTSSRVVQSCTRSLSVNTELSGNLLNTSWLIFAD